MSRLWSVCLLILLSTGTASAVTNVLDYGAIPNDGLDDKAAFDLAFEAVETCGTVYVPAGTYDFMSAINIKKCMTFQGDGPTSILKQWGNMAIVGATGHLFIGDRRYSGQTGRIRVTGVTVRKLKFVGDRTNSIYRVVSIRVWGIVSDLRIEQNTFEDVTSTAVLLIPDIGRRIHVLDNVINEVYEQCIELGSEDIRVVVVRRNDCRSTADGPNLGAVEPFGIIIETKTKIGTKTRLISDVVIEDNYVDFEGLNFSPFLNTGCISLSDGVEPSRFQRVAINNNTCRWTGTGVRIQNLREGENNPGSAFIKGNTIEEVARECIYLRPSPTDHNAADVVKVRNNICRGYSRQSANQYSGIRLDGWSTAPLIDNNQVLPLTQGDRGKYGINIGANTLNAVITNNHFDGWNTAAINDLGTGTTLSGNTENP